MEELKKILDAEEEDSAAFARCIEFAICALSTRPALTRRLLYKLAEADAHAAAINFIVLNRKD